MTPRQHNQRRRLGAKREAARKRRGGGLGRARAQHMVAENRSVQLFFAKHRATIDCPELG